MFYDSPTWSQSKAVAGGILLASLIFLVIQMIVAFAVMLIYPAQPDPQEGTPNILRLW